MAFNFLLPVSQKVLAFSEQLPPQALGNNLRIHTEQEGLPGFTEATVALFGVVSFGKAFETKSDPLDMDEIRMQLYRLMKGNWHSTILDLGDIAAGDSVEDTFFLVKEIVAGLFAKAIIPVVIGATQDLTFATYRAFDGIKDRINLVSIDSRFDFGTGEDLISSHSYMSKIITDKPNNLFNFSNIGYQSYFTAQEEIDLMERLFFEAYRLGDITANLTLAEPVLRDADLVSLDVRAVRAAEMGLHPNFSPNGFTGREICALARYAGLSDRVSLFGVYEAENASQTFQMIAQIVWYFIEGVNFRIKEYPDPQNEDFIRFTVPTDLEALVFYKSGVTARWWVEVPSMFSEHTKINFQTLLPCTEEDYIEACRQNIPQRWFKAFKKNFN